MCDACDGDMAMPLMLGCGVFWWNFDMQMLQQQREKACMC